LQFIGLIDKSNIGFPDLMVRTQYSGRNILDIRWVEDYIITNIIARSFIVYRVTSPLAFWREL
jgi:hypothetical protein